MSGEPDPIVRPAKAPPPELSTRAARPRPVRIRRNAVIAIGLGASAVFGGALAWAFVVAPQLRAHASARPTPAPQAAEAAARPSEIITRQPATYAAATLPPPRQLGGETTPTEPIAAAPPPRPPPRPTPAPAGLSLVDRARGSSLLFESRTSPAATVLTQPPAPSDLEKLLVAADPAAPARALISPASPYEVKAGAIIPAAMLTALDTTRPGAVVAVTTEAVYDTVTGRTLLIPPGARLLGRQDGASKYGDRRAFISWERLILPNGKSLVLAAEPAVDPQGALGVRGRPDRRILPLLQGSLFAGAITTLGQAARDRDNEGGGWLGDAGDAAAIQAAQIGGRLIGRELDIAPSIRLPAGAAVRVLVTHDLVLEPYR
jgi:type IV secretion system protein VirB10